MAKKPAGKNFASPGQKYAGQIGINTGPVQLRRWIRPLTRAQNDHPDGLDGRDLRPERDPRQTSNPPGTPKGTPYNR